MRITLPHVGESVTEAVIERWLKQVGDRVEKYEPLAEVVTDKVSMEMPSPVEGVLTDILVDPGQTIPMGAEIAEIATESDEAASHRGRRAPACAVSRPTARPDRHSRQGRHKRRPHRIGRTHHHRRRVEQPSCRGALLSCRSEVGRDAQRRSLPRLRDGSQRTNNPQRRANVYRLRTDLRRTGIPEPSGEDERVPLTAIRRMIAENMKRSVSEIPEAWSSMEVDMTNVMAARERAKDDFERREGARLTPLAFALKAVAESLRANPIVNSTWADDAIILKGHINLGVAIATERGLLVPVIPDADRLSVAELAKSIDKLASKARANRLDIADVQGGTFTVNNTGALGSVTGKGIINHPQAAILNTESIVKRPVIIDDAIAIRSMMNICLTFDHRIMDGREAGAFLADVKRRLEGVDPAASI